MKTIKTIICFVLLSQSIFTFANNVEYYPYRFQLFHEQDSIVKFGNTTIHTFIVSSKNGVGSIRIKLSSGVNVWPEKLRLRLQYVTGVGFDTLEGLRVARVDNADYIELDAHKLHKNYKKQGVEVIIPLSWLAPQDELGIQWIDVYRR